MASPLTAMMTYAKDREATADVDQPFFGLISGGEVDGLIQLRSPDGAPVNLIHQAAAGVKLGQAAVKTIFSVDAVEAFKVRGAERGLAIESTHHANGYVLADAKDPDKNPVSISGRAYRTHAQKKHDIESTIPHWRLCKGLAWKAHSESW